MLTTSHQSPSRLAVATRVGALGLALGLGPSVPALAEGFCSDPSVAALPAFGLGTHNTLHRILPGSPSQSSMLTDIDG